MDNLENRIESIVRLIINKKYSIPKGNKKNEYVKTEMIASDKRPFEGIMTDLVTNKFLEDNNTIAKYIKLITSTFNMALDKYIQYKNLQPTQLHFVYKGGNVLRVLAREFMHELPGGTGEILNDYYKKFFKKSDADFSIYIDPSLSNFEEVFDDMTNMSYLVISIFRNIFLENMSEYFDFFKNDKNIQHNILKNHLNELNESVAVKELKDNKYYGGKVLRLVLGDIEVNADGVDENSVQQYKGSDRNDYTIVFKNDNHQSSQPIIKKTQIQKPIKVIASGQNNYNLPPLTEKGPEQTSSDRKYYLIRMAGGASKVLEEYNVIPLHKMEQSDDFSLNNLIEYQKDVFGSRDAVPYFISANRTLRFVLKDKPMAFNLVRMKANIQAVFENKEKNVNSIKLAGEMIDVSILHNSTTGIHEFFKNLDKNLKQFEFTGPNSFKFKATSKEYLIHDLELILFGTVMYPWEDIKYGKRIKRLLYLYLIDMLSTKKPGTINDTKKFFFNFQNECILSLLNAGLNIENFDSIISQVISKVDKNKAIAKNNEYYILTFLEKYKSLLKNSKEQIDDLLGFVSVLKENFDVIDEVLNKLINFTEQNKGKVPNETLYTFDQWGGKTNNSYYAKYLKYKTKYIGLKNSRY